MQSEKVRKHVSSNSLGFYLDEKLICIFGLRTGHLGVVHTFFLTQKCNPTEILKGFTFNTGIPVFTTGTPVFKPENFYLLGVLRK